MALSDETRTAIILAAVQAASATAEQGEDVLAKATDIASELVIQSHPRSRLSQRLDRLAESAPIHGVIESIEREESSTRGVVTIKTRPSKFHPDGLEQARTERTDNADGAKMARTLQSLVGHRVLLYVFREPISGGEVKIRVISYVTDLGVAE
jgi:hypothetical protein